MAKVLSTPEALYFVTKRLMEGKEVSSTGDLSLYTTRPSNTIGDLRNVYGLKISTVRQNTDTGKWYGLYVLVKIKANTDKAKQLLKMFKESIKSRKKPLTM